MAPKAPKGKDKGKGKAPAVDLKAAGSGPPKPKKIPPPPACFNTDDIVKFKEIFKLYDEDGIDKVPLNAIPVMLRKLGFNPKGTEIKQLFVQFLEDEFVDTVELHEWYFMIEAKMNWGDDFEHAVTQAMAALGHDDDKDPPTGFCDLELLRTELMNWGEPLSDIEFIDWIRMSTRDKTYTVENGLINYPKFIENMNSKDTRYIQEPVNFWKLDQKTLAEMAMKKAAEEKEEMLRKEHERALREEYRRQKMIEAGLLPAPEG